MVRLLSLINNNLKRIHILMKQMMTLLLSILIIMENTQTNVLQYNDRYNEINNQKSLYYREKIGRYILKHCLDTATTTAWPYFDVIDLNLLNLHSITYVAKYDLFQIFAYFAYLTILTCDNF